MHEPSKGQESRIIAGIPQDTVWSENLVSFSPSSKIMHSLLACEALLVFKHSDMPPFCKKIKKQKKTKNQLKSNIATETTPIGVTNVQRQSQLASQLFYSLHSPLSLILLSCCLRLLSSWHEIDTPGSTFCANPPPAATADFTNDGEIARRVKG